MPGALQRGSFATALSSSAALLKASMPQLTREPLTPPGRLSVLAGIGTPLDKSYPAKNRALQERLMHEYLVLTQFAHGYPVQPKNFPIRNRTMALISHATIIVEAQDKSGSLHQGWEALRLGRPLFVLDRLMNDDWLTWPKELAKYGALPLSPERLDEISDYIPEHGRALDLAALDF